MGAVAAVVTAIASAIGGVVSAFGGGGDQGGGQQIQAPQQIQAEEPAPVVEMVDTEAQEAAVKGAEDEALAKRKAARQRSLVQELQPEQLTTGTSGVSTGTGDTGVGAV